jgi:hypothetical protein
MCGAWTLAQLVRCEAVHWSLASGHKDRALVLKIRRPHSRHDLICHRRPYPRDRLRRNQRQRQATRGSDSFPTP